MEDRTRRKCSGLEEAQTDAAATHGLVGIHARTLDAGRYLQAEAQSSHMHLWRDVISTAAMTQAAALQRGLYAGGGRAHRSVEQG